MLTKMRTRKTQLQDFISGWNISQKCDFIFCGNRVGSRNGQLVPEIVMVQGTEWIDSIDEGATVYCKTDMLPFLRRHLYASGKPINLITHDSDFTINKDVFTSLNDFSEILSWRGCNINYQHDKLKSIPLGLANDYCPITLKAPDIMYAEEVEPRKLLYINFNTKTNPQDREPMYHKFKTSNSVTVRNPNQLEDNGEYIEDLTNHKFSICPRGNGIDTHRMWECLYLGIIPIVKDCVNIRFFEDLPILVVEDYMDLVGEDKYLEDIYTEYQSKDWNLDKLTTGYWV